MGIYQNVCYKVEDAFVKLLTKKEDTTVIKEKVATYRTAQKEKRDLKKVETQEREAQLQKKREEKKNEERKEVLSVLSKVVDINKLSYTEYEFNELKRNKHFFEKVIKNVFEAEEFGLTFVHCEFDKSSRKEIKGYLIATNKRVWFIADHIDFQQKYRYQTIKDVSWFKDGILERRLKIQYGVKKLEFDEIFDSEQLRRFGDQVISFTDKY
ncbi:hypothetical protein [Pseudalkalibacillus decolorationis]|uniref:hypothetical protein n=1 Tax=Pseudalkalibacillus decolorationis TaxID=163879 RepID=UPI0021478AD9|nr:hypothetical protein [Pseudalkalibacillus decolorationis]